MTKVRVVLGVLAASVALFLASVPVLRAADEGGTPWLGVYTQELTGDLREGLNYNGSGVLVSGVVRDSPADRAGVRKGDVITRVDGRDVRSPDALADLIQSHRIDDRITVRVVRDRSSQELKVTLAERKEDWTGRDESRWFDNDGHEYHFDLDGEVMPDLGKLDKAFDRVVMIGGRGRLGVRIQSMNEQLGEYFQIRDGKGALVLEVVEDSPAQKAGLQAGDVITKLGARDIDDAADLTSAVSREEGKVSVTLVRHGRTQTVEADLGDAPKVMTWRTGPGDDHRLMLREHARELRDHARQLRDRAEIQRGEEDDLRDAVRELRQELREMKRELEEIRGND